MSHFNNKKIRVKKSQYKILLSALMIATMAVMMIVLPNAFAHTPPQQVPTYAYLTAAPNPIGVDQEVYLLYWLDKVPPTAAGFGGDRWGNLTIDVTKPDGSKETIGPFISDPVGGGYTLYKPTQVGQYTFNFKFPGQVASLYHPETGLIGSPSDYVNDTYLPSSATAILTVQQEKISYIADFDLPTSYWSRPIEGQNTNWASIASNYLAGSAITGHYQPDGKAPDTAHIMWTKPISFGGVVGGSNTGITGMTFYDGTNYEGKFSDPIILYGRLYYTLPRSNSQTGGGYVCVDLQTGEEIWRRSDLGNTIKAPSFAQLYDYESMNQHGVIPNGYLWSANENPFGAMFGLPSEPTVWTAYDPLDGTWLFNLTDIPLGTEVIGPQGEILRYVLNLQGNWLALWNNTAAHDLTGSSDPNDLTSSNYYQWRPIGKNVNASNAYSWNVSIPQLPARSSIIAAIYNDRIIVSTPLASFLSFGTPSITTVTAISVKEENRGQILWTKDIPAPPGNATRAFGPFDPTARVFTFFDKETISYVGYSIDTGEKLWGPTAPENPWNYYSGGGGALTTSAAAEGKLYSTGYSGIVYCYDIKTGTLLWNYSAPSGLETPYTGYPLGIAGIADGKIYLATNEHSSGAPYWRGAKTRCLDTTNGEELWTLYSHGASSYGDGGAAIADGYFVYLNLYDMQVICIGKGPSKTTVEAPLTAIEQGQSIVVRGTVTDIAAGARQLVDDGKFNIIPAISDADQGKWMEYLYMQKPMPKEAQGVSVHLTATDSNNNVHDIGTVTTDASGLYSIMWKPQATGKYTITATFEGSKSYWPSSATTAIGVVEAAPKISAEPPSTISPATSPTISPISPAISPTTTSPAPASPTPAVVQPGSDMSLAIYIAIAATIIIAAVATAAAMLRRRAK